MRKFFSLLIAAMLLLSIAAVAMAENDGKITVTNAVNGQYYKLYRLLDADVVDGRQPDANGIRYYSDSYTPASADPFEKDDSGNITFKATALDNGALKPETIQWIKDNLSKFTAIEEKVAADGKAEWTGLKSGYYFIDTTTGTLVTITSIKPDMSVEDKNKAPELTKKVKGGDATDFVDANTATIGDELTYQVTVKAEPGAQGYIIEDTLSAGLTLKAATEVTATSNVAITADDYTAVVDGQKLTITIGQSYLNKITAETDIVFTYKATLNENAVIAGDGNTNRALLKYGAERAQQQTPPATTTTKTFKFGLYKIDGQNKILTGATFKLYSDSACETEIPVVAANGGYRVALPTEDGVAIEAGRPEISGLKNGTYYLKEQTAPAGYNKCVDAFSVVINNNNNVGEYRINNTTNEETYVAESGGASLVNNMGAELPKTGGVGTTMLYIGGAILLIGAVVILVSRKHAEEAK